MTTLSCPLCGAAENMPEGGIVWARCPDCSGLLFRPSDGPKVLIAHESDSIAQQVGLVLLEEGFAPLRAPDGRRALGILDAERPPAAVLDVALSDLMSFQLVDYLRSRAELKHVKVILVASVFNRTAYKRRPSSLYGADDYVEQHHIPDMLPRKLRALLGLDSTPVGTRSAFEPDDGRGTYAKLAGSERADALARSIVADIALYNEAELHAYLRERDLSALAPALNEGRRILAMLVGAADRADRDPILDAFRALVEKMEQD